MCLSFLLCLKCLCIGIDPEINIMWVLSNIGAKLAQNFGLSNYSQ